MTSILNTQSAFGGSLHHIAITISPVECASLERKFRGAAKSLTTRCFPSQYDEAAFERAWGTGHVNRHTEQLLAAAVITIAHSALIDN